MYNQYNPSITLISSTICCRHTTRSLSVYVCVTLLWRHVRHSALSLTSLCCPTTWSFSHARSFFRSPPLPLALSLSNTVYMHTAYGTHSVRIDPLNSERVLPIAKSLVNFFCVSLNIFIINTHIYLSVSDIWHPWSEAIYWNYPIKAIIRNTKYISSKLKQISKEKKKKS